MSQHFNEFLQNYERGLKGDAITVPITKHARSDHLSKLGRAITIAKSMYVLVGGSSGTGKTSIVDCMFLINLYLWWKRNQETMKRDISLYWIYRSMERPIAHKIAKWTCLLMYIDHGILIDVPTILGWSNKMREITEEENLIIKSYDKFFDELFQCIDIKAGSENPTGVRNYARSILYQKGKYFSSGESGLFQNGNKIAEFSQDKYIMKGTTKVLYLDVEVYGKNVEVEQYNKLYIPRNTNEIVFHITDHAGKVTTETRNGATLTEKQVLDKHYEYNGEHRDIFGVTPIDIVQLNRAVEGHSRMRSLNPKNRENDITITNQDFKGSGNGYENADLVIGLINPYKLGEMDYGDYKISEMMADKGENRFRAVTIVKNSYGIDDGSFGYCFVGENGLLCEISNSTIVNAQPQLYNAYRNADPEILLK